MGATFATAPRGEAHYRAKLTEHDVRLLRALAAERRQLLEQAAELSNAALAAKFGVTPACVERVLYGQTWSHVGGGSTS